MSKSLGEKIRICRESKGLSLDQLSRLSGVTRDHIGRIERGESQNPRKQTIDALAQALETSPHLFLSDEANTYLTPSGKSSQVSERAHAFFSHQIPLISFSKARRGIFFDSKGTPTEYGWGKIYRDENIQDPQAYALNIDDNSMAPRVMKGDVVILGPGQEVQNGDLVLVKLKDDKAMLKNIWFKEDAVLLESSQSAQQEPMLLKRDELQFIHKVVRIHPK